MRGLALILTLGCSEVSVHMPNPLNECNRIEVETHTALLQCTRLQDTNGRTLFKLSTSESCGGPPCLVIHPGETAYVLELDRLVAEAGEWTVQTGPCEEMEPCCADYYSPCGGPCCW